MYTFQSRAAADLLMLEAQVAQLQQRLDALTNALGT